MKTAKPCTHPNTVQSGNEAEKSVEEEIIKNKIAETLQEMYYKGCQDERARIDGFIGGMKRVNYPYQDKTNGYNQALNDLLERMKL